MENLRAFLIPQERKSVFGVVSDRYLGEEGKPIPWEFRALSHRESQELLRESRHKGEVDFAQYQERITAASVVYPDLKDAELQKGLGTMGDEGETLRALLPYMGEMAAANKLACEANGLSAELGKEVTEAKNG